MILESILTVFKNIFNLLLVFEVPKMPTNVYSYINDAFYYMSTGAGILANYTPLSYLLTLFFLILAVDTAINIYHLAMWIIRKIPFTGIT